MKAIVEIFEGILLKFITRRLGGNSPGDWIRPGLRSEVLQTIGVGLTWATRRWVIFILLFFNSYSVSREVSKILPRDNWIEKSDAVTTIIRSVQRTGVEKFLSIKKKKTTRTINWQGGANGRNRSSRRKLTKIRNRKCSSGATGKTRIF